MKNKIIKHTFLISLLFGIVVQDMIFIKAKVISELELENLRGSISAISELKYFNRAILT